VAGAAQAGPSTAAAADGLVTGFAYGFHGEPGQWWHDLVLARLTAEHGAVAADHWLGDSFEVAEVHVHPDFQGCGTGRAMVLRLVAECPERTAVLSTMDGNTRARRLYRGLGFLTLLSGFTFPGAPEPYAVMGAALPLRGLPRPGGRTQPGHSPAGKPESLVDVECGT
jgi:GNAT superfamily N-acetyltransferase